MSLPLCVCRRRRRARRPRASRARSRSSVTARPSGVVLKYFLPPVDEVERAALDRDDALAHHRLAAVDEPRLHRAVLRARCGGMSARVRLVGLREVGGVRVDLHALLGQPRDGAAGVEATRERDADAGALRRERLVDAAHGPARSRNRRRVPAPRRPRDSPARPVPRARGRLARDDAVLDEAGEDARGVEPRQAGEREQRRRSRPCRRSARAGTPRGDRGSARSPPPA